MFEEEAEEHTKKKVCKNCTYRCDIGNILKPSKLDCFAYAREYKTFKDGCKCGYNKANEWHFVKDGDLPKENDLLMSKTLNLITKVNNSQLKLRVSFA